MSDCEIWNPVPGYAPYEASSLGRVRTPDRSITMRNGGNRRQKGKIIKPYVNAETAPYGVFYVQGGRTGKIHLFVCLAFHGPQPEGKRYVCHKDGDPTNNVPDNLYWGTAAENQRDRQRHDTSSCGERHHNARLTDENVRDIHAALTTGAKQKDIAKRFGVTQPQISNIKNGRRWAHA